MNAGVSPAEGTKKMRRIWHRLFIGSGLILVACGLALAPHAMAAEPPWSPVEVSVFATDTGFDFANDDGIPFFTNDRDSGGKVNCDDACTGIVWLPVWARANATPMGEWSIVIRPDKAPQWAYKGKPIYTYAKDVPGEAKGDGVGGLWHVLKP